ncbi:MAG: OmpA family protein [Bacteroidota bacterium]
MNRIVFLVLFSLAYLPMTGQNFTIDTVFFGFDQFTIKSEYEERLDTIISALEDYPNYYVEVFGHTDSIGTDIYNQTLSEMRAREVMDMLVRKGLTKDRIEMKGFGTSKPAAPNTTFSGRSKNRRADLAVIFTNQEGLSSLGMEGAGGNTDGSGADGSGTGSDTTTVTDTENLTGDQDLSDSENGQEAEKVAVIDTIYAKYRPFPINPQNKTVVFAPQGSQVVIEPNSFDTEQEQLNFEVKELFERKDILQAFMPTVAKVGALETAGMMSVKATDRGRIVRLRADKPINVTMPSARRLEGVNLYEGKGGERGGRRRAKNNDNPAFDAVKSWVEDSNTPLAYDSQKDSYGFQVNNLGRINVARPLYVSEGTNKDDDGFDIFVKLKGKRFEKNTNVFIVGSNVETYIPLKKESKRNYEGSRIRHFREGAEILLVAFQFDNDDEPYFASTTVDLARALRQSKKDPRPYLKAKVKFKRTDKDELVTLLEDL